MSTVHRRLGSYSGLGKILGLQPPSPPRSANSASWGNSSDLRKYSFLAQTAERVEAANGPMAPASLSGPGNQTDHVLYMHSVN